MTRVTVIGGSGQLGSDLVRTLRESDAYSVISLTHADLDCTNPTSVRKVLKEISPEITVNCAAFVEVDECEAQPNRAFQVNAVGAFHVAKVSGELGALSVYMSTDFVFDGARSDSYSEDDTPNPINVYGTSKLAGEHLVREACPRWLIVRTASLFGKTRSKGKHENFVDAILGKIQRGEPLRIVDDLRMSPTYTRDAARALERLFRRQVTGLIHLTNVGSCTWYEFASMILNLLGLEMQLEPISSREYHTQARRPLNSSLTSVRLPALLGQDLRPWQDALGSYLSEKGYSTKGERERVDSSIF